MSLSPTPRRTVSQESPRREAVDLSAIGLPFAITACVVNRGYKKSGIAFGLNLSAYVKILPWPLNSF